MARTAGCELEYLAFPSSMDTVRMSLAEPVRAWFSQRFGEPTPAQRLAWPVLDAGQNLLLCAPTGSGKTLAAFLPIVSRLLQGCGFKQSVIECLYITPLKALGNDIHRNLRRYLRDLRAFLPAACELPRVGLRTGDTSARQRRDLYLRPPSIFLTTPESLAVLLSQPSGGDLFHGLRWVVVDEVHALVPNKRGADLSLSLERLEALCAKARPGETLQRIGLSATCAPLAEAARFLVGAGRSCTIAQVADTAALRLTVEPLETIADSSAIRNRQSAIRNLIDRLEPELALNRSTLVFTNTRSLAERLGYALRQRYPDWQEQIAVHHSALAAARRRGVERRLKQGRLRVVVSSTSLELGIDIGSVDGVVLVHPPGSVVRLLQRVGRGGHGPGQPRNGLVLTTTTAELLEAAVTAASKWVEPLRVPAHPLDVLCQQLLGMAAQEAWSPDEAFDLVRRAYPYRELTRQDFDACLDYLSGRRPDGRPWLPARLRWEGDHFTLLDERTARLLRRNIGTIITAETCSVLIEEPEQGLEIASCKMLGEVEETFADRLQPGDRFLLDGRCLEFRRSDGPALLVQEVADRPAVPRWGGDGWPLSADLARRLYLLRVQAAEALRDGPAALAELLRRDYGLQGRAVAAVSAYFQRQEGVSEIPDATTLLVEAVGSEDGTAYYCHTPLNRAANDVLARLAIRRLARDRGGAAASVVADLGFALFCRSAVELRPDDCRQLLSVKDFDADLTAAIAGSVTLRERFRRVALTGLMLLRNPLGRRRRVGGQDWAERRLFAQVSADEPDFVLLRQAVREIREECCDAEAARAYLEELPDKTLRYRWLSGVSPFAENWTQTAAGPAETAESQAEALQRLHALLQEAQG